MTADNDTNTLTDEKLVIHYRKTTDKDVIGTLFKRHTRFVFLVCMKYMKDEERAKDAAMQIFESLFAKLRKHEVRNFKPWLHTVTKNHCLILLRNKKEFTLFDEHRINKIPDPVESEHILYPHEDKERQLQHLEDAILSLSKEQRVCIELFYLKKQCYQEVSKKTGFTYKQVKSYIQNGKRNLRIYLEQRDER